MRVAIVGSHRNRVARVVSLLHQQQQQEEAHEEEKKKKNVEYLPCVATFGTYESEEGEMVSYLASVQYHGPEGQTKKGSSLAPFFDEIVEDDDSNHDDHGDSTSRRSRQRGIQAVVVGCGIEGSTKVDQITNFVKVLSGSTSSINNQTETDEDDDDKSGMLVVVECIQPNEGFPTMAAETEAYRKLDPTEKAKHTELGTLGPGKMAKFVAQIVTQLLQSSSPKQPKQEIVEDADQVETTAAQLPQEELDQDHKGTTATNNETTTKAPPEIDPTKTRYACRRCRQVLFGEDDLEYPPHTPARHAFRRRNHHKNNSNASGGGRLCESLFLATGMDWMGDMSAVEGKLGCPHCGTKVGAWKWAGAQCSCGTWVTPAIQIPHSKVDVVKPDNHNQPPPGTVVHYYAATAAAAVFVPPSMTASSSLPSS